MRSKIVLTIFLLLVSCGIANASSISNWGPTGVMEIPTADVLGFGIGTAPNIVVSSDGTTTLIRVPFILGIGDGLEIGVTDTTIEWNGLEASGLILHGKVSLISERTLLPGVAIGGILDTSNILGTNSLYLVISKGLGNIRGHIGLGSGIYDGVFGGLEFNITDSTKLVTFLKSQEIGFGLKVNLLPSVSIDMSYYGGLTLQISTSITL
ncbi:MAG: hypothetical protein ACP5RW_09410 [bacterium]